MRAFEQFMIIGLCLTSLSTVIGVAGMGLLGRINNLLLAVGCAASALGLVLVGAGLYMAPY